MESKPAFAWPPRPSLPAETKSLWKYCDVQKRRAQFEIMDNYTRISMHSMKEPIPFPTSALNLLEYCRLLI
jgi:hypothetical protein